MSVVLATWEAEIRRIKVLDQPRQIVHEGGEWINAYEKWT
jgi:hypothetical protein